MVKRWVGFRNPWEREYAMRGSLWSGTADASFLAPLLPASGWALELGCGDGKFLRGLEAAGFRAVGLDFSRRAARLARAAGSSCLLVGDVRALPCRAGAAGFVAARYILGALREADRRHAAAEIDRVLAADGALLVEEFSRSDFRIGSGNEVEPGTFERNRGILTHYFERAEIPNLFPDLHVISVEEQESVQRTKEGAKRRHRWRWLLARHGSNGSSSRRTPGTTS